VVTARPIILIPCDVKHVGIHPFHAVGEKYIDAVAHGACAWPLLVPAFGVGADLHSLEGHYDLDALLALAHGVFLPGSTSNVAPPRYGAGADPDMYQDPQRDAVAFPLIERTLALGLPLLAVCRGMQELNVALGGTLHPRLHELPGHLDHRDNPDLSRADQYLPAHPVQLTEGGQLARLLGRRRIEVNSLHGQGVADLAPALAVEAVAPDGVVEAVRVRGHPGFALGVQWHPEWRYREDPVSVAVFGAFGEAAARQRAAQRRRAAAT
jgi:putative glutamine amidotransferase